jgi:hypothetical protein
MVSSATIFRNYKVVIDIRVKLYSGRHAQSDSANSTKKPPAILSLIGETPLVEITQFDTGPCQLLKLKIKINRSIKDRIALSMIEAAEEEGNLNPAGR